LLDGTKKIAGDDYNNFIRSVSIAAEMDNLPVAVQLDDVDKITINDIREFIYEFHRDTGFSMTATFFMCNECGCLHMIFEVDYDDNDNTMIQ